MGARLCRKLDVHTSEKARKDIPAIRLYLYYVYCRWQIYAAGYHWESVLRLDDAESR